MTVSMPASPNFLRWTTKVANILIVDRETDSRLLLKRLLELDGHVVAECSEPDQIAQGKPVDLAIVNITTRWRARLPGVLRKLKGLNDRLKIITIMDHKAEKSVEGFVGDDVLVRPSDLETIEGKVRELLSSDDANSFPK